jgi:methionyl-tRNA synthetase
VRENARVGFWVAYDSKREGKMSSKNPTIVTCALPYANGAIHLGHMVEHIQTDIFVRYLRSAGEDVAFLCADDTHGSPIELSALKAGVTPEEFVGRWSVEHQRDFKDFQISFDHYGSTNSDENKKYAEMVYLRAKEAGSIARKDIEQPYDEKSNRWLSDRFIRGTCPNCKSPDQYGDACEKCNATYNPKELIDARSSISGEPLQWKPSSHLFFSLGKHEAFLKEAMARPGFMNAGAREQLQQFFQKGLADWDITRDGPYFGFRIPGEENKYFYVWLDAPIGYIASTEQWAKKTGKYSDALALWNENSDTKIIHVIGKDIVYFHCLFWPAVLHVAKLKLPSQVHIHGHLTVNGQKMSKTKGTFVNARPYLDILDPNYLRFYYASLLGNGAEDIDLSLLEFRQRVNAELVNNLGNLANRTLSLLAREELGKKLAAPSEEFGKTLVSEALSKVPEIAKCFAAFDHRAAVKLILEIGFKANQFLAQQEPWKVMKTDLEKARSVLSEAAEIVYLLAGLLEPIVPEFSAKLGTQLNRKVPSFKDLQTAKWPLLDRSVTTSDSTPLINRLDEEQVNKLIIPVVQDPQEAKTVSIKAVERANKTQPLEIPKTEIEYGDFAKIVLKSGKVLACEKVPKADKLLKLSVDVGEPAPRTIVSGIAEAYAPEAVIGKSVVVVMNLKPKPLRGIDSHGMLLTAGKGGKELILLDAGNVAPGTEIK